MEQKNTFSGLDRQREIYLRGISGITPKIPTRYIDLQKAAKRAMTDRAFGYIAGGAGSERTIDRNQKALAEWLIQPRMLRNVASRDLSINLFGRKYASPFFLSPIGVLEMAHKQADLAVGRAAASLGIPYIFSNQASIEMERTSAAMGQSPRWFQLYWSKSYDLVESLVSRAESCGCEAIVVTLDTTLLGWRPRDLDLANLPFLQGKGIAQYTSDPVFQRLMEQEQPAPEGPRRRLTFEMIGNIISLLSRYPEPFFTNLTSGRPLKAVRTFINIYTNPALHWGDLTFLRERTKLPIVLKGILHPEDAKMAIDHGVDGILVSNHGGRQVDGSVSSIEMLPSILEAVRGQIPVLLDSGVRSGADALKAIALGAKAVGIGRPYAYGLAVDGQAGVEAVLKNFLAEFDLSMGLVGTKSIDELSPAMLRREP
ncbi:MAG: lactate 2-monooxygenase [Bacteroidota bacterium]